MNKLKVLLVVESCNPEWSSVPLVGYHFYRAAAKVADVTLVTHARNKESLLKKHTNEKIYFIKPGKLEHAYYKIVECLTTFKGRVIWPLYHVLSYPIYFFFDRAVKMQFAREVIAGQYDIVHALTPMMPRYPVAISKVCTKTPFILGPVNGGVPFPEGFKARGRREFSQFNFFRDIGRAIIPNYKSTYQKAAVVISGSTYTKRWLESALSLSPEKVRLMYENGVPDSCYAAAVSEEKFPANANANANGEKVKTLNLIFSGRLVPYKGCDLLLRALAEEGLEMCHLTILGDGAEKSSLEDLCSELGLAGRVTFAGWVANNEVYDYYAKADLFVFPSVREFGGAVVMEAMAQGLPCVVVDNGGIGEYVDESCGTKIAPVCEVYVIEKLAEALLNYVKVGGLLNSQSIAARAKAEIFSWGYKADVLAEIYDGAVK